MMEKRLLRLGFAPGLIVETVVSTYNPNRQPAAAPMGVTLDEGGKLVIRPFTDTQTFRNLRSRRHCVVNLTADPRIFFHTAFKGEKPSISIPPEWFEKAEKVNAPRLRDSDAYLEASVVDIQGENRERASVFCRVEKVRTLTSGPKAYCRATFALIESIIHATRVAFLLKTGKKTKAGRLLALIAHYRQLVGRTAPKTDKEKLMEELVEVLRGHGASL
ncbi:DUF447 domain-containing protein [Candidatus Hecatella orcuttiae]|jgi:hypothetical protein|uniref:DUF447 domain-containing protein n=1 Tax=Candidatus Hecatella orcuttiae TaxID=1935119 RepID=UPI00286812A9|nr:DUF447 domain-containing protein [Candidatus Hecatella orcuttiae]